MQTGFFLVTEATVLTVDFKQGLQGCKDVVPGVLGPIARQFAQEPAAEPVDTPPLAPQHMALDQSRPGWGP